MLLRVYWCVSSASLATLTTGDHVSPVTVPVEEVLEESAPLPLLFDRWRTEDSPDGLIKHSFKATLSQG